ncbi:Insecticidal toxin complex protein [Formosa sp. S-31]|uniref:Insecticidal toxin complex protein n=1 Tax=Formosa sp. S-31 TaxID=2790949 RepID=UPI003EB7DE14
MCFNRIFSSVCWYALFILGVYQSSYAKEWQSLKAYQKATKQEHLAQGDWLKRDRIQNNGLYNNANRYNLLHNCPEEYPTVKQRYYFYNWLQGELHDKKVDVNWVKMARFISKKLSYVSAFPYKWFVRKSTIYYSNLGSEVAFSKAFGYLNALYSRSEVPDSETCLKWDLAMLEREQYNWVESVYQKMDESSLKQIERIAKGKSVYRLFIPKALEFKGNLSNPDDRYNYALETLLPYCSQTDN